MCLYFSQQERDGGSGEAMALLPPLRSHGLSDHTRLIWKWISVWHWCRATPTLAHQFLCLSPKSDLPEPGASRSRCHRQKVCLPQLVSKSCCVPTLNKMDRDPALHPAAESELHNIWTPFPWKCSNIHSFKLLCVQPKYHQYESLQPWNKRNAHNRNKSFLWLQLLSDLWPSALLFIENMK